MLLIEEALMLTTELYISHWNTYDNAQLVYSNFKLKNDALQCGPLINLINIGISICREKKFIQFSSRKERK